jgi:steroid delta-isomerase
MPSAELITQTVNRYIELVTSGSADDIVELYTDDATVEDPVGGGETHIGRQAILGFYKTLESAGRQAELLALRVGGHEAAFMFALTVTMGDAKMRIEPLDVMSFDDAGKITAMKAYWGPENVTQL